MEYLDSSVSGTYNLRTKLFSPPLEAAKWGTILARSKSRASSFAVKAERQISLLMLKRSDRACLYRDLASQPQEEEFLFY